MTLQELTSAELSTLRDTVKGTVLKKLLESRIEEIKEADFSITIKDVDGMLRREYLRGMCEGYKAVLMMDSMIEEEYDLRKKEDTLAQENKR